MKKLSFKKQSVMYHDTFGTPVPCIVPSLRKTCNMPQIVQSWSLGIVCMSFMNVSTTSIDQQSSLYYEVSYVMNNSIFTGLTLKLL